MKRLFALFLTIILLTSLFTGCSKNNNEILTSTENQDHIVTVEVINPFIKTITLSQTLSGKLNAAQDIMIIPEITYPAKVKSIKVNLGEKVSKGQVLFILDDESIKKQIEQAQSAYDIAKANLLRTEEQMENAKLNLERTKALYEIGAVSKQVYEQALLSASDTSIEVIQAQVYQAKVALDQAKSQLEKTVVKSPIDGYIAMMNIKENEFASNTQPAIRIVNIDKLTIDIGITEQLINKVKREQEVEVTIRAVSNGTLKGIVKGVSPAPDQRTQLYPVEIEVENKDGVIKAGMFAEIIFITEKRENVLSVPSHIIIKKEEGYSVYVVEEGKAVERLVEIGLDNGRYVEVINGLFVQDEVVIKGQDFIENNMQVNVIRGEQ